jgi:hypothetical protein
MLSVLAFPRNQILLLRNILPDPAFGLVCQGQNASEIALQVDRQLAVLWRLWGAPLATSAR